MAGKTIAMNKLRKTLKLYAQGRSKVFIGKYLQLSRNTVKKYIKQSISLKIPFDEIDKMSDQELEDLFIIKEEKQLPIRTQELYAFFPYMEIELRKTGVTKALLWEEYKVKHPSGVQSSQFSHHYNIWVKRTNVSPVMRMVHKAGDKMFIDHAGKTLQIVDDQTGEITEVQFFVAILGASHLTYAEATMSQKKGDFITSVENALHYFGGVPQAIVPDNLKSAVTKSNRYEPAINETFLDFSEHYGTTILPARVRKPQDKSLVEGMVKILYTRVYSALRNEIFFSLNELNQAILVCLKKHNRTKFTGKAYSRQDLFEEIEAHKLELLPQQRYEIKQQSHATVMQNGHVLLSEDKHYYSVPYQYIRKKVKLSYTSSTVEIYHKHNRIGVHSRIISAYNYSTIKDHLASTHQFMTEWNPQRFISWGKSIGPNTELLVINILEKKQHPEQSYKSCMGVLSLGKKAGNDRLENACSRALEYGLYNYKIVQKILEKGLDKEDGNTESQGELPLHTNIRGKEYYQ